MKIITIAHQKGGVGKSTLALNLAYAFESEGIKTGLVDQDLQGSLTSLYLMADGLNLVKYDSDISKLRQLGFEMLIIDTPPYLSSQLPFIFSQSDLVIIPTKAGFFDMMAIHGTISLLNSAMKQKPKLKAGIVFNMVKHHSSLIKEIKGLQNFGIPVFSTLITDRVSFSRSIINGGIMKSSDQNAIKEMMSLCEEIVDMLEL